MKRGSQRLSDKKVSVEGFSINPPHPPLTSSIAPYASLPSPFSLSLLSLFPLSTPGLLHSAPLTHSLSIPLPIFHYLFPQHIPQPPILQPSILQPPILQHSHFPTPHSPTPILQPPFFIPFTPLLFSPTHIPHPLFSLPFPTPALLSPHFCAPVSFSRASPLPPPPFPRLGVTGLMMTVEMDSASCPVG